MKFTTLLLAGAVLTSAMPALSQDELLQCSKVDAAADRLACYDKVAGRSEGPAVPIGGFGKWKAKESRDALTDDRILAVTLDADSPSGDRQPYIVIRCQAGATTTTEMYIAWDSYVNSEPQEVSTRIGNEKAVATTWQISGDRMATFYPGDVPRFIDEMEQANKFVALTVPYNESPVTAIFDTTGLKAASEQLGEACGWR